MTLPLVSVIVPTCERPQFLPMAVRSALEGMGDEIEIIVVPNGPDQSWRQSLASFADDIRVIVAPIAIANGNAARNHGLELARGKFIRFLDDDDYLHSTAAVHQYEILEKDRSDVVSGNLEVIDWKSNVVLRTLQIPQTTDFCAEVLGPNRKCLPHMHVYRREALANIRWNPATKVRQDVEWQFDLCASREWLWSKTDSVVGVWRQHWGSRVSQSTEYNIIRVNTVEMILRLHGILIENKRISEERRLAAAEGLWALVHSCFFLSPRYWTEVAMTAGNIYPNARPQAPFFHWPVVRHLSPVALEWMLLPKRRVKHQILMVARKLKLRHAW